MSRPITAVHVDIARFLLEVSQLSAESPEKLDAKVATWTRDLARCLAMRDPTLHSYGAHLLAEVDEYRKAEIERKSRKHSAPSADSKEGADSLPRSSITDQSNTDQIKKKKRVRGVLAHVDPGHLPPAKPVPTNIAATRALIKPFAPPTLEEVQAYCAERKSSIDPERFLAHYDSNGWKVGRNPMKSWKSAIITWEKNDHGYHAGTSQRRTAATPGQVGGHAGERRAAKAEGEFTEHLSL